MDGPADEQHEPFQGLPRSLRLKRQRLIRPLFDRSRDDVGTISRGSIRLLHRVVPRTDTGADAPVQVGFAPGRASKAVRRNRIKRILREVYRINQSDLVDLFLDTDRTLTLMILYRGSDADAEARIRRDVPAVLEELGVHLREAGQASGVS